VTAPSTRKAISVSDGYCNNPVVKFDKNGRFLAQAGSEKAEGARSVQLPARAPGLMAGQRLGGHRSNFRYQVLDNNLKPRPSTTTFGVGWTVCISPGPHQYVFAPTPIPTAILPVVEITGEIYKLELDGTIS